MPGEIDEEENEFAHDDLEKENNYETYTDEQESFETSYANNGVAYEHIHDKQVAEVIESQVASIKSSGANATPCEGHTCWAKNALNQQLGLSLPVDNKWDEEAKKAIGDFQSKNNLPQTQKIDAVTERALLEKEALRRHTGTSFQAAAEKTITEAKTKIEDWTKQAVNNKPQHILNSYRDPRKVYAFVLHHMAFKRKSHKTGKYSDPNSYLSTGAHFFIMLDGRIIQLHPISRMIWHGNCISPGSVAVEFEGNFPNIKGQWWINKDSQYQNKDNPTQAQFDSGRFLAGYLKLVLGTTHILAHRQSSDSRENDPGPDIWYNVGQWAVDKLGLSDGGPTFKCGTGNPILPEWRTWGNKTNTAIHQEHYETTEETEEELNQLHEEETRSYSGASSRIASTAYMTISAQKQGQIKGGVTQKGKEGSIAIYQVHHQITSPRDAASGQASGKRIHKPLVITKEVDTASIKLFNALVTNETLKEVVINFFQHSTTTGQEVVYYRIKLSNASIANISQDMFDTLDPAAKKLPFLEKVEFVYQKIEWEHLIGKVTAEDDNKQQKEVIEQGEQYFQQGYFNEEEQWDKSSNNEALDSEAVDEVLQSFEEMENTDLHEIEEFGNLNNQQQAEIDETTSFEFATPEEETPKELSKKLKFFSLLPHTVEINGKDVALTPELMDPGIYDGPEKFKVATRLQESLV
ncbi:MAG: type VI secretion system tube protein TssD, partial [Chitinophagaceae bacterium]